MMTKLLKVKNGDVRGSANAFLADLLRNKKVHALLVPQEVPSKKLVFPALISDPDKLKADIFAPLLPVSTAQIIAKITKFQESSQQVGVVMHPCQIRAVLELTKLNQAQLNNIVFIGVDCLGTIPFATYTFFPEKTKPSDYIIDCFRKNNSDADKYLRTACKICVEQIPRNVDLVIGLYGANSEKELILEVLTDVGKDLVQDMNLEDASDLKHRQERIKKLIDTQTKKRVSFIKDKAKLKGIEALAEFLDTCVNCHNCRKACPICYCKECLFDSSVFDAEAFKFLKKAEHKGLIKMPPDSLLFHLGRMNHMILSCVTCGLCEQACPNNIPLMDIFIPVAESSQKEFKYHPGKDLKEKIPLIVYREDEYTEIGEK